MGKPKLLETRCSPCYIAALFQDLETNQAQAKLDEIEEIGFGFLKLVPKWNVKQGIMAMLANAYDIETSTLRVADGVIRIGAELFERLFGIPPGVDDFPPFDASNADHVSTRRRFHRLNTIQLRQFVNQCTLDTEDDRIEFRRHFILLVLKMFLCPTVQHVISPWHIDTILDVSDPGRFRWPLHIFKSLEQAIRKYQCKKNKSCEGCMFALLVLYFHKLKHGDLNNCQEPQSWLSGWTAKELSAMAATIQPEAFNVPGGNDGVVLEGAVEEHTMGAGLNKEDTNHTVSPDGCKKGSDRREGDSDDDDEEPIAKRLRPRNDLKRTPKSCSIVGETRRTSKKERTKNQKGSDMKAEVISGSVIRNDKAIAFDEDDEDNQPIGKIIHIKTQKSKPPQQKGTAGENIATSLPKTSKNPTERYDAEPKTPSAAMIDYSGTLTSYRSKIRSAKGYGQKLSDVTHCEPLASTRYKQLFQKGPQSAHRVHHAHHSHLG
ncbi:uncharacterized protein [Arachis hypogaea]|uniref:uncharacterized protein isoform X2 n=1 Tax=Arachis hypogaea TaxID=3818 RepID=UPI000DEC9A63|nr:uncharacterized protein LOC112789420 isoform X3 [Arachis hypogaea]